MGRSSRTAPAASARGPVQKWACTGEVAAGAVQVGNEAAPDRVADDIEMIGNRAVAAFGAASWPLAVRAQQAGEPVIGLLSGPLGRHPRRTGVIAGHPAGAQDDGLRRRLSERRHRLSLDGGPIRPTAAGLAADLVGRQVAAARARSSGHAAALPPSSVMNSRLFIQ